MSLMSYSCVEILLGVTKSFVGELCRVSEIPLLENYASNHKLLFRELCHVSPTPLWENYAGCHLFLCQKIVPSITYFCIKIYAVTSIIFVREFKFLFRVSQIPVWELCKVASFCLRIMQCVNSWPFYWYKVVAFIFFFNKKMVSTWICIV